MKQLTKFRIAILMLLFVSILGCNNAKGQIQSVVDKLNEEMPISLGLMGEMTNVSISNGYLNMVIYVNEDVVNIEALKKTPELVHNNLVQLCTNSNSSDIDALIKMLKDSNLGFRLSYFGKTSGKSVSASLTNSEIREISYVPASAKNPIESLESQVRITNAQLPLDLGGGMTMYKMALEGGYLVYYYKWDDESVNRLAESIDEFKQNFKKEIKYNDDPSVKMMRNLCKEAGVGMACCYVAKNSGKKVWVKIGANEL